MYTSIDNSILSELSAMQISTYITIKKFMSFTTYKSRVAIRRIAKEMGVAKNTAYKYVKQLADKGVILRNIRFNKEKQEYDTTEYYFIKELESSKSYAHVGQNSIKSGATVDTELSIQEVKRDESVDIDINLIRKELLKDYNDETITKAFKTLSKAIKRGTVIDNIKAYVNKLCGNIKTQEKLVKDIKVDDDTSIKNKHKKSPSGSNTRASKNKYQTKFHNFKQRTDLYTADELEKMVLKRK